jgi:NHL repeat
MEIIVTTPFLPVSTSASFLRRLRTVAGSLCVFVAACGGGADAPPPDEGAPAAVAPVITQQPADASAISGQPASFTVTATGTAPLAYQWQRDGTAIEGATAPTYALPATTPTDTGAVFRAVVSNIAGTATSNNATLTVTTAAPVLTVTQQPADASVVAGSTATFTVAATCSSSTLNIQWQRNSGTEGAFVDVAGASAASYTLTPAINDDSARFRTNLSCSGQSITQSGMATLSVTAPPSGGVLSQVVATGLRNQADISRTVGIVRESSGSFAFTAGHTIRRLSADLSTITLIAGSSTDAGSTLDGAGTAARFNDPRGITADPAGNLYIVDIADNVVRRIATDGTVITIAGQVASPGTADGSGSAARFNFPWAIAMGSDGDLYVADRANHAIRRVTTAGVVTTYAGAAGLFGYIDGAAATARFNIPAGIAVAADLTVYVADGGNSRIRRIARSGNVAGNVDTLAGSGANGISADGTGTAAGIVGPGNMTLEGNTLYVRDSRNLVRAIDIPTTIVTTVTGNAGSPPPDLAAPYSDGPRGVAFNEGTLGGIAAIGDGRLLLTDPTFGALRLVGTDGYTRTIAVSSAFDPAFFDHTGVGVLSQRPFDFTFRPALAAAPDGSIVVAGRTDLRRILSDLSVAPIAGLVGRGDVTDGANSAGLFVGPIGLVVKPDGTIVVFDGTTIRTVAPATNSVTTLAGSAAVAIGRDGTGSAAGFQGGRSIVLAPNGDFLAVDTFSQAIRRITPAGVVTTFSGSLQNSGEVDGPAGTALFHNPTAMAIAPDGTLWVIDAAQSPVKLRKVAIDGSVTSVALTGDAIELDPDSTLAVDPAGNLFVLSGGLYRVEPTTGAATLLIPTSQTGTTFGTSPTLAPGADRLTAVGVKQLVFTDENRLLRATLP